MGQPVLISTGGEGVLNRSLLPSVWIDRGLSWLISSDPLLAEDVDLRSPLETAKFLAIFT